MFGLFVWFCLLGYLVVFFVGRNICEKRLEEDVDSSEKMQKCFEGVEGVEG
nr:hypothetical protein [Candidatus Freyarchaeota archaeon]